jgi:hypothetical protein
MWASKWPERIRCGGGQRLTVRRVLELIAIYPDQAELFRKFPGARNRDASDYRQSFVGLVRQASSVTKADHVQLAVCFANVVVVK